MAVWFALAGRLVVLGSRDVPRETRQMERASVSMLWVVVLFQSVLPTVLR